jgi:two-component SAPR family response regulator
LDKNTGYDLVTALPKYKFILITAYSEIVKSKKYPNLVSILQKPVDNLVLFKNIKNLFKIPLTAEEELIETI